MGNLAVAADLLLSILDRASAIGNMMKTAQAEKRDITDAELDALALDDDAARVALKDAIAKARAAEKAG